MKISEIVYKRYNVENIIKIYEENALIIKKAKNKLEVLNARKNVISAEVKLDTAFNLAYIRWSLNTVNEFYLAEKTYYEENVPLTLKAKSKYLKAFLNSKFLEEISPSLPKTLLPLLRYDLIANDPKIKKYLIKENALVSEYSNFTSGLTVNFNGEEIPFTNLKKYMFSKSRETRKNAYNSLGKALENSSKFLDNNFNKLVKIRTKTAQKLGFDNFTKLGYYRMNRIGYGEKEIASFREGVLKYIVPVVNEIKKVIYKNLKIDNPKLYDNDATLENGDVIPNESGIKLFEAGAEIYKAMSKETGEFFNFMLENEAFDCLSRKNKWGGGYQTDLKEYKTPFILANFNGSSADVDVLTHEAGHAFASYQMAKNGADEEVGLPFMEIAETHSMSMEFFCYKYVSKLFGENTNEYILKHFVDSFCFIPYGVMVDAFQEEVYNNYNLTPAKRNKLWLSLERKYRPYMDSNGITYLQQGTRWQYQMHIYESPFYYVDYALAQVNALQFLFMSLNDYDLAFSKYNEFISLGANLPFLEAIKKVGLKSPFEVETLKEIASNALKLFSSLNLVKI